MTAIRLATASDVRSFQRLANALITSGTQWAEQIDQEALQDEFGRFRVWSGNLGALQKGHSSLDYRLRDSPLLSGNALKFLGELNHNLDEAVAIVCGNRLPYEDQLKSALSEEKDEEDEDDFFSEDEEEHEADGSRKELTMRYEEIVDIIDSLYKLSVRIRTPTIRSRSLKVASYQPKDPETGMDILGSYAQYDKRHVQELLRNLRQPNIGDTQIDEDYLESRLACSITLRRRHFKYWKRHRDKLAVSTVEQENDLRVQRIEEVIDKPLQKQNAEMEAPEAPIALVQPSSQKTGRTMLSGTEATRHHQSLDDLVDTKSVTSYAVTVTDVHGKGVNLPAPPKCADGERDFECPYCYIICPARYGRGRAWRTHVLQDLQPYICTYPECEASEQLFRSRREWNEHEASHRKAWRCPEHPAAIYKSRIGLEDHLRKEHLESFPETQLDTIIKIGETSTIDARERCPICSLSAHAEGMGDFANHLANHLERFAAFALPNSGEEDEDGASSVASRGRTGSTASQAVDDMSLPSDTSDIQRHIESSVDELRDSDKESMVHYQGFQDAPASQRLLSVESLRTIPDVKQDRLNTLLATQADETDNGDDPEQELHASTGDVEEQLERAEKFRTYLLSLPGAQTVRFYKRYGSWRGHAMFEDETQVAEAIALFDITRYPDINVQQGTENNRKKLKFSVQTPQGPRWQPTRQPTSENTRADNRSTSPSSMIYDDNDTNQSKQAILDVIDIPTLHDMYRSRKILQRDQSFAANDSHNRLISFCYYDITRMRVDAIVNSANNSLKVSRNEPTLNYHVHKAGGRDLTEEAKSKGRLKSGQAALTGGHNLPCAHVIHASRPQYGTNQGVGQFNILAECYRSALRIALASGFKTIAFPCLGAGGCGFPPRVAARLALQEIREFLDSHGEHRFERIIFVVKSVSDEKAYMDMFPVFFPPTHGDLEAARSSESSANRASLAAQVLEIRLQVQKVAQDLSAELSTFMAEFPKEVIEELLGIDSSLASVRSFLIGSKELKRSLDDLSLLCSVMQVLCGSVTEVTESAKNMPFSGGPSHKELWDDFNNHQKLVHGSDLERFLEDCQDFAQYLDDIITRGGVQLDEMTPVRLRLVRFKAKQKNEDAEGVRDRFDEVLYTREFQRETNTQARDVIRLHQIPSLTQLYASNKLEEKATMAQPSDAFNQTVCLVREDITKLDATVMVSSTDMTFAGMGTLDRKVFNKGGFELREACRKFGVCKEGDVKLTGGYNLPSKHILHAIPPEQWRKNSKDVLRKIYQEILYTAQSLRATSVAIPAIGTGMLNYPRRDCASLAVEEVHRFLETAEPTLTLEKIIFTVYSSNDEFVYKSVLPVYFPPVDRTINKAIPASHLVPKSVPPPVETVQAPRRTLFSSIGDAVRSLGSSRSGKRPVAHTWRAINSYEEHALIGFESHAKDCDTCKFMEQLYQDGKDLCKHGYPLAQTVLWYMNMGQDLLVYTRPVQIRQSIRLEVPDDMFPLSMTMLRLAEVSVREKGPENAFVGPNRAYSTVVKGQSAQDDEVSGPTIYNAETARASVEVWSTSERAWGPVSPGECIVFVRPGKLDVYEAHAPSTAQEPLLTFVLDPAVRILKHAHRPGLVVHGATAAQFNNNDKILLLSQNVADSDALLAVLNRANPGLPVSRDDLETSLEDISRRKAAAEPKEPAVSTNIPVDRVKSNSGREEGSIGALKSISDAQDPREDRLSPLQLKMQKLEEAASRFKTQSPEQQSMTLAKLSDSEVSSEEEQTSSRSQVVSNASETTLTALQRQILHHLTEDLKSRPGSYIGQNVDHVASALSTPVEEIVTAMADLAKLDYVHNTINESTWVISRHLKALPALERSQPEDPSHRLPSSTVAAVRNANKTDMPLKMDLLERQILTFFSDYNAGNSPKKGCRSEDIADALKGDLDEVELALDQLAEQGKVHLAPDRESWNTPLPRQYIPPIESNQGLEGSSSTTANIRDATEFKDTPPSPVIPPTGAEASDLPPDTSVAVLLETQPVDDSSLYYPYDSATGWTRIDKSYIDPQVLAALGEEYHEDGYSVIVHRILRHGEMKDWVKQTLDLRLKKTGTAKTRKGVNGHTWLGKEERNRDERDLHQTNLDRVLAGDMREDELRHFKGDEEKKR